MKIVIDTTAGTFTETADDRVVEFPLYSRETFERLSALWVKVGWNEKYPYTFSWMGRPIIQLPEDMVRMQEVIFHVRPTVVVETGVAHGGSLVYYASLLKAFFGGGRVIGLDIEIRPHNRQAIESHSLASMITLIEGDSTSDAVVERVEGLIGPDDRVLVVLDSNHSKDHVSRELERYARFVTPGSYIVATDGVMQHTHDVPRGQPDWDWNNPAAAARAFAEAHPEFALVQPEWPFNESGLRANVTHWPDAWLLRREV